MKFLQTLSPLAFVTALSLLLLPAAQGFAQTTATTDPVGYAQTTCLANSDTKLSLPFTRPPEFVGAIGSVSSNTITVASAPNWAANQYVYGSTTSNDVSKTYYAIIGPNVTPLANPVSVSSGSATVTGSGFTAIAAGDEFLVNGLAYNVAAVASDTSLTLSDVYAGATASGLSASYDHSPKEGSYYTVTANGTNAVTVNLNGDTLSAVAAGTTVSLIPYWTLGTAFPASDAGTSYIASTNAITTGRNTQILLPDLATVGVNLANASTYYYYNSAWRKVGGSLSTSFNDTLLLPSTYFTLRNTGSQTAFTPAGGVYMNRVTLALDTQASAAQDNSVSVTRPVNVTLNDLGLISSGAFVPSTNAITTGRKDQLFVFDNTVPGVNKAASATYYYYNNAWRKVGGSVTTDFGTTPIPYGTGFIIRKAPNGTGATSFAQNTRDY